MEFLMTYGWSILVVLAAFAALAYFGVLSPEDKLPEKCILPAGLACKGFGYNDGTIQISIENSMGFRMKDIVVSLESEECNGKDDSIPILFNWEAGKYVIPCPELEDGKFRATINVYYVNADTGLAHNDSGSLHTNVIGSEFVEQAELEQPAQEGEFSAAVYDRDSHTLKEDITSFVEANDGDDVRVRKNDEIMHVEFSSQLNDGNQINLYVRCIQGGTIEIRGDGMGVVLGTATCAADTLAWVNIPLSLSGSANKFDINAPSTHVEYDYISYS